MMWYYGSTGWDWLLMAAVMVLFWGGVIALAIWAIRSFGGRHHGGDPALDVLRKRLAAGEITRDEYENTKKALGI